MRVYLDTNVLVSAFSTRGLSADVLRLVIAEHELMSGEVNLKELRRVLRSRFRLPRSLIEAVEQLLREHTIVPRPDRLLEIAVRDSDDAWVLASAVAGGAEVLVTGDKDLLAVAPRAPLRIVDPRAFWELARRRR